MNIGIEPRKTTDRGGYLMMPLRKNVPDPSDETWSLTNCPKCGRECWNRLLPEGVTEKMFTGKLCTMCALKAGMRQLNKDLAEEERYYARSSNR